MQEALSFETERSRSRSRPPNIIGGEERRGFNKNAAPVPLSPHSSLRSTRVANNAMLEQAESIGLAPAAERDAAGGPLLEEEETVLQQFADMQLVIGGTADQGEGTLYFTEW